VTSLRRQPAFCSLVGQQPEIDAEIVASTALAMRALLRAVKFLNFLLSKLSRDARVTRLGMLAFLFN